MKTQLQMKYRIRELEHLKNMIQIKGKENFQNFLLCFKIKKEIEMLKNVN